MQFCFQKHRSGTWNPKDMFSAPSGRSVVLVVKKLVQKIIRSFLQKNDKRIKKLKNKDSMAPQPGKAAKVLDPPPEFLAERLALWDRLKAEQDATLAAKVPEDITVTLPDGKEVPGQSWRTTPYEVSILKTLFQTIS